MKKTAIVAAAILLTSAPGFAETYRLVHAIGNTERVSAKDLSKRECDTRKAELKSTAAALGTGGSITCLPDSLFDD